jgi:hypothetical protein
MAERTNIPASQACGHWETLLADALDGLLSSKDRAADQAVFNEHMSTCPACAVLFEEARRGRQWLEFLAPEPEVPAGLLDKILAHTGAGQKAGFAFASGDVLATAGGGALGTRDLHPAVFASGNGERLPGVPHWQRPGFMGFVRRFAEPRLMMTAAMAFFSIALTLNLTGVKVTSLKLSDLRPATLRSLMERRLTTASTPIIRYYDHLRVVYEVESRMRELRRATQGEGQGEPQDQSSPQKPGGASPSAPGESKKSAAPKDGGRRMDPPLQSVTPARSEPYGLMEVSLTHEQRPAHSGGSAKAVRERSTRWTA